MIASPHAGEPERHTRVSTMSLQKSLPVSASQPNDSPSAKPSSSSDSEILKPSEIRLLRSTALSALSSDVSPSDVHARVFLPPAQLRGKCRYAPPLRLMLPVLTKPSGLLRNAE
jgi:hypothetical protein